MFSLDFSIITPALKQHVGPNESAYVSADTASNDCLLSVMNTSDIIQNEVDTLSHPGGMHFTVNCVNVWKVNKFY